MAQSLLLGIDLGTTVLKAGVVESRSGRVIAQSLRRLGVHMLPGGGREQSPRSVDRALREILGEIRSRVGAAWSAIGGIGVAAQGGSSIIAERDTGKPLTPMVLWNDGRTHAWLQRVEEKAPRGFWGRFLLYDVPATGLGRLLWLKETRPDLFRNDTIHMGAGEYLFYGLTGIWRQDAGNAIQIGSYNARTKRLDRKAFDLIGVPLSFVAPLRQGHETARLRKQAAARLQLREGIPVAGPYIDQEGGYMSCLGVSERPLQGSLGTAWVGNFLLPDSVIGVSPTQMVLPSPVTDGRFIIQALHTGNTSWDWALTTLVDRDHGKALDRASRVFAERLLPQDGLAVVPWFTQPNPFDQAVNGAGVVAGLSAATDCSDILRAVAAGMAFEFCRMFEALQKHGVIDAVVIGGGASKGACFRQLLSALFDPLPVHWQVDHDLAAARGSLFALDARAARSKTQRILRAKGKVADRVRGAYETYLRTFERTYGGIPSGRPFVIEGP